MRQFLENHNVLVLDRLGRTFTALMDTMMGELNESFCLLSLSRLANVKSCNHNATYHALGFMMCLYILLGGNVIYNLEADASRRYSYLDDIHHCVYGDKSYVQLTTTNSCVATVILANRNEESVTELKVSYSLIQDQGVMYMDCKASDCLYIFIVLFQSVFEASLRSLRLCERAPWFLAGAGCWQTVLASFLQAQVINC